jgi:hypothetical protein
MVFHTTKPVPSCTNQTKDKRIGKIKQEDFNIIWCLCFSSLRLERRKRQTFDSGRDNILNFPADSLGDDFSDGLQNVDITSFISAPLTSPDCDSPDDKGACDVRSQFRTITGRCNNLRNPNLGKSISTFARLLSPSYEDSKWI